MSVENEVRLNLGIVSIPENRIWKVICWIPTKLAGADKLYNGLQELTTHVSAMTDILHIVVADRAADWPSDKTERVQRHMANFKIVNSGLELLRSKGNPFTADELRRLQLYTQKAESGEPFRVDEAQDYRQLSECAAREYPGQDWVKELLKVAFLIFALYVVSKILNPEPE